MENTAPQGILTQPQPGFYRVVLISLVLHAVAMTAGLLLVKGEPTRLFYAPVYTTVDLVAAPPVKPKPRKRIKRVKKKTPAKAVKKTPAAPKKPAPKKPATIKTRATPPPAAKPTPDKSAEEKIFVSEKIKDIEKKSRQREEELLVASRIEEIKKKGAAEKEKLEALRKEIAEEEEIQRHIEELKKELETAEAETRTVEAEPPFATTTSARAASGSIKRELFDLEHKAYYNKVGYMVQSLWVYPGAAEGLNTVLSIKIARSGELKKVVIEKRSGNALFDESARRAVKKAAPFPPLPEGLGGDFLELGLRFCPGGCYSLL